MRRLGRARTISVHLPLRIILASKERHPPLAHQPGERWRHLHRRILGSGRRDTATDAATDGATDAATDGATC